MSWWVKEISTITEDQSERLCIIETDTPNDLPNPVRTKPDPDNPGQTITDYTIVRGSEAYCLSNSKTYKLNSQGQWVEQNSGQEIEISADDIVYDNTSSGMTATNVQDAIDEIKDLDDMQDRALAELYGEDANQQLEINYAINTGSKNLLPNKYAIGTVTETNGFRFTAMEDGGIKIESIGTHNANGDYYILGNWGNTQTLLDLSGDTYTVTFSSGTTISGVSLRIFGASNTAIINNLYLNNSRDVTDVQVKFVFITVTSTTTLPEGGITVYPMIRNAVIRNSTFEPYAPTNRELYETKTEQTETNVIVNLGAKNMLKVTSATQTINGVTFTVNDDQTVTVNGTNTGAGSATFVIVPNQQAILIPDGNYILSGCPNGGGDATYDLRWYLYSTGKSAYEQGYGVSVAKNGNTTSSNIAIVVKSGVTANNLVFKPMLRPAEITDSTYVPYAPTNRELYEMILALQSGRSVQSVSSLSKLNLSRDETLETDEIKETEETTPLETNEIEETE